MNLCACCDLLGWLHGNEVASCDCVLHHDVTFHSYHYTSNIFSQNKIIDYEFAEYVYLLTTTKLLPAHLLFGLLWRACRACNFKCTYLPKYLHSTKTKSIQSMLVKSEQTKVCHISV